MHSETTDEYHETTTNLLEIRINDEKVKIEGSVWNFDYTDSISEIIQDGGNEVWVWNKELSSLFNHSKMIEFSDKEMHWCEGTSIVFNTRYNTIEKITICDENGEIIPETEGNIPLLPSFWDDYIRDDKIQSCGDECVKFDRYCTEGNGFPFIEDSGRLCVLYPQY